MGNVTAGWQVQVVGGSADNLRKKKSRTPLPSRLIQSFSSLRTQRGLRCTTDKSSQDPLHHTLCACMACIHQTKGAINPAVQQRMCAKGCISSAQAKMNPTEKHPQMRAPGILTAWHITYSMCAASQHACMMKASKLQPPTASEAQPSS